MIITSIFCGLLLYLSRNLVRGNEFLVQIEYGDNNTFSLYYNLTTNYSYYLTFRLFEHEQIKFGLFSPTIRENTLQILNQYDSSTTFVYLFITCFHFIHRSNEIDIQCKDIRLFKSDQQKSSLPSYKPLFVPMMYALSILMLLPVIIQHRRRKQAQVFERHKQIRRLSITIAQDHPSVLSSIVKNGMINLNTLPIEIELLSMPSTRTILDDVDDHVPFIKQKSRISVDEYEKEEEHGVTADDCVAHLLNSTPWNSKDSADVFNEQCLPMIPVNNRDYQPLNKRTHTSYTINLYRSNPAFIESDV